VTIAIRRARGDADLERLAGTVNSKTPDKDAAQQLANKLETETMLRARGIAPYLLLVRSAGMLEPMQLSAGQSATINRRVTFNVSTSD
jgi:hypothetical protein